MDSAYDADRIFGILTRLRAGIGLIAGLVLFFGGFTLRDAAAPPRVKSTYSYANGSPLDPREEKALRAMDEAAYRKSVTSAADRVSTAFTLAAFVIAGVSAGLFVLGGCIRRGERRGFLWSVWVEGLSGFLGLLTVGRYPLSAIGIMFSLATFAYCLTRLTGTGPRPTEIASSDLR